jgi:hypothetical protein
LLVIEAATFLLVRGRVTRALLVVAMLMDLIPLGMFALHFMRATRYQQARRQQPTETTMGRSQTAKARGFTLGLRPKR